MSTISLNPIETPGALSSIVVGTQFSAFGTSQEVGMQNQKPRHHKNMFESVYNDESKQTEMCSAIVEKSDG